MISGAFLQPNQPECVCNYYVRRRMRQKLQHQTKAGVKSGSPSQVRRDTSFMTVPSYKPNITSDTTTITEES